jgi:hypothetical protein
VTAMTTNPTPRTPPVTIARPERAPSMEALRPVHDLVADLARLHPKRPAVPGGMIAAVPGVLRGGAAYMSAGSPA